MGGGGIFFRGFVPDGAVETLLGNKYEGYW